ncbi:hypothetical protein DIPPA_15987 [Diplonema papillatum]|nr:hypothetical protein DIPPA_15987 [Diplonema papillatum]
MKLPDNCRHDDESEGRFHTTLPVPIPMPLFRKQLPVLSVRRAQRVSNRLYYGHLIREDECSDRKRFRNVHVPAGSLHPPTRTRSPDQVAATADRLSRPEPRRFKRHPMDDIATGIIEKERAPWMYRPTALIPGRIPDLSVADPCLNEYWWRQGVMAVIRGRLSRTKPPDRKALALSASHRFVVSLPETEQAKCSLPQIPQQVLTSAGHDCDSSFGSPYQLSRDNVTSASSSFKPCNSPPAITEHAITIDTCVSSDSEKPLRAKDADSVSSCGSAFF